MSERDRYQPGVPCWVEALEPDPRAAVDFYGPLFGWQFEGPARMPGDPPGQYFVARLRGKDVAGIGSRPAGATPPPPAWHTHVSVASADLTAEKAVSAGGSIVAAPLDAPPAGRMAVLADPTGAVFSVWQPGLRHGAQLVNEPSAWSMSRLDTSDPTRAAAFYAELFGWTTETFDLGDAGLCRRRAAAARVTRGGRDHVTDRSGPVRP